MSLRMRRSLSSATLVRQPCFTADRGTPATAAGKSGRPTRTITAATRWHTALTSSARCGPSHAMASPPKAIPASWAPPAAMLDSDLPST